MSTTQAQSPLAREITLPRSPLIQPQAQARTASDTFGSPSNLRQQTMLPSHSVIDVPPRDPPLEPQCRATAMATDSTLNVFADNGGSINSDNPGPVGTGSQQNSSDVQAKPMSISRLRWWLGTCVAFAVLAPVISVTMGMTLHATDMQYPAPPPSAEFPGRTVRAVAGYWGCVADCWQTA
ncbi:hypothetical protein FA15DRAFT_700381 [Coprinopsis marcescibilis]|uniref:Uncharacterized protein n=1 Tax=Coprinopsis marcescibilis TaxID=230819 RepID=A0A5C3LKC0_COPMA|nr:hypothetical protein FA15DRAFT_700381 [Coprinopsis marcescibilis]